MANAFDFNLLTHSPERLNVISSKLGPDVDTKYSDMDKKKPVKAAAGGRHVLVSDGDELEGWIDSVEAFTVDGYSFGGVARGNVGFRVEAQVAAAVVTPLVFGDLVVAGIQIARGTKGLPQVKKGTPAVHKYRVLRLTTGAAGSLVLLEKV